MTIRSSAGRLKGEPQKNVVRKLALRCPSCAALTLETMPMDACQYFFECPACKILLKPKAGDCCVFCSYGSVPCPPVQTGDSDDCCRV